METYVQFAFKLINIQLEARKENGSNGTWAIFPGQVLGLDVTNGGRSRDRKVIIVRRHGRK